MAPFQKQGKDGVEVADATLLVTLQNLRAECIQV